MPLTSMPEVIRQIAGSADTYISQSAFLTGKRRTISAFKHVNSCWVDLDYYNDQISPEEWSSIKLQRIVEHGKELGIPAPSMIVDSGQGAYVRWIFDAPVYQLPIWNRIQQTLTALYTALAADHKSKDASRVLRPIGTINTKNNTDVNVIQLTGIEYNFNEFVKQIESLKVDLIDPLIQCKVKSNRVHKSLVKLAQHIENAPRGDMVGLEVFSKLREPLMLNWCEQSLHWARFTDLRDIVIKRGGFQEGERDLMLFWMCNSLAQAGIVTPANWDSEINSLLHCFPVGADFDPIRSGYLSSLKRRMFEEHSIYGKIRTGLKTEMGSSNPDELTKKTREKLKQVVSTGKGLYRPSNAHLIHAFGISQEEQAGLRTLISKEEKQSRRLVRIDRRNPGRAANRVSRNEWHDHVRMLAQEKKELGEVGGMPTASSLGINVTAISKEFEIDRTVVSKYLKKTLMELFGVKLKTVDAPSSVIRVCDALNNELNNEEVKDERPSVQIVCEEEVAPICSAPPVPVVISAPAVMVDVRVIDSIDAGKNGKWASEKIKDIINICAPYNNRVSIERCGPKPEGFEMTAEPRKLSIAERMKKLQGKSTGQSVVASKNAEKVITESSRYYVAPPRRPAVKFTHPIPTDFSPVSLFGADTWAATQEGGRFIVVEIMDRDGMRLQRFSETAAQSSHDVYGEIIALTDPAQRRAVLALRNCTVFSDSNKRHCRMQESLEAQPCLLDGERYWVARPMHHYLGGGGAESAPFKPNSSGRPAPVGVAATLPPVITPLEGDDGDEGDVWVDDPAPY